MSRHGIRYPCSVLELSNRLNLPSKEITDRAINKLSADADLVRDADTFRAALMSLQRVSFTNREVQAFRALYDEIKRRHFLFTLDEIAAIQ